MFGFLPPSLTLGYDVRYLLKVLAAAQMPPVRQVFLFFIGRLPLGPKPTKINHVE
jgi:hypothetical protein